MRPTCCPSPRPRQRLAYDELLANQLALALVRAPPRRRPGRPISGDGSLRAKVDAALPFALTDAQRLALAEIDADMAAPNRMLRLLQGDVGSGKTVVALLAMLAAVEDGRQAALLAPDRDPGAPASARRWSRCCSRRAGAAGLLTGRDKGKAREGDAGRPRRRARSTSSSAPMRCSRRDVDVRRSGLAVIDEQHRFGVHQRLQLSAKGERRRRAGDDGDADPAHAAADRLWRHGGVAADREAAGPQAGRHPRVLAPSGIDEVVGRHRPASRWTGGKAYWVCPLVEESETIDLAAAERPRRRCCAACSATKVGLVHGRMKAAEKDAVMAGFADGRASTCWSPPR